MGKFGVAGTRTKRVFNTLVEVKVSSGEHLHFFIRAQGAAPIFSLACTHKTLWSEKTFGPPAANYERVWPLTPLEVDSQDDEYVFKVSFFAASKYTLRLERHDATHQVLEVVNDIDYESTHHADQFREFLTVISE